MKIFGLDFTGAPGHRKPIRRWSPANSSTSAVTKTVNTADQLDALLCAIQTAWAATQPSHGRPPYADRLEDWIVDPVLLR